MKEWIEIRVPHIWVSREVVLGVKHGRGVKMALATMGKEVPQRIRELGDTLHLLAAIPAPIKEF
jgi:hypothetical protein